MSVHKILFVGLRALGDMVLSMSAVQAVKDTCPDAAIDYVMETPFVPLFSEESVFRSVIGLPRSGSSSFFRRHVFDEKYLKFLKSIRSERYDAVFDLFSRGPRSRIITLASGAKRRIGIHGHPTLLLDPHVYTDRIFLPNALTQMSDQMLHIVSRLGFATGRTNPVLTVRPENVKKALDLLVGFPEICPKGFYILFPGSGMKNKNWPAPKYMGLSRSLMERGFGVLALGGPSDSEALGELSKRMQPGTHLFKSILQSDLPTLKGLISLSRGVVGNDSGPIHLAQAVGKKVVALFGPGDHVSYRPFNGTLVRSDLGCSPCQTFGNRCPDNLCMQSITVETVLEKLDQLETLTA